MSHSDAPTSTGSNTKTGSNTNSTVTASRVRRIFKRTSWVIVWCFIVIAATTAWLMGTQSGLSFALARTQAILPELSVKRATGRLIGPLTIEGLAYTTLDIDLVAQKINVDWQVTALLSGHVSMSQLALSGIHFHQLTASQTEERFEIEEPLPDALLGINSFILPVNLTVEAFNVADATYYPYSEEGIDNTPIHIEQLAFSGKHWEQQWQVSQLRVDSSVLQLDAQVSIDLNQQGTRDNAWNGALEWSLPIPEMATLQGVTNISGNAKTLVINQDIKSPYNITANVSIDNPLAGSVASGYEADGHDGSGHNGSGYEIDATVRLQHMLLSTLKQDLPAYTINGELDINGNIDTANMSSQLSITDKTAVTESTSPTFPQPVQLTLDSLWDKQQLILKSLRITPALNSEMLFTGDVDLEPLLARKQSPKIDLAMVWNRLQWPLNVDAALADISSERGRINVDGSLDELLIDLQADIGEKDKKGTLAGIISYKTDTTSQSGSVLEPELFIDADLNWQNLLLPQQPNLALPKGRLRVSGSPNDYLFDLKSSLISQLPATAQTPASRQQGQLKLSGTGTDHSIHIPKLKLEALGGVLDGGLSATFDPKLSVSLNIKGEQLNPAVLNPQWPGELSVSIVANSDASSEPNNKVASELNSEFTPSAKDKQVSKPNEWMINIPEFIVQGQLRELPVFLSMSGALSDQWVAIKQLLVKSGDSIIEASARVDNVQADAPDIVSRWSIDSQDLGDILPSAKGSIQSQGQLQGTLLQPKIDAAITMAGISFEGTQVKQASANIAVDWRSEDHEGTGDVTAKSNTTDPLAVENSSTIDVTATGVSLQGSVIDLIQIKGRGRPESHQIDFILDSVEANIDATINGQLVDDQLINGQLVDAQPETNPDNLSQKWFFQIPRAQLSYEKLAPWNLESPLKGMASEAVQVIDPHCWVTQNSPNNIESRSEKARLCLDLKSSAKEKNSTKEKNNTETNNGKKELLSNIDLRHFDLNYIEPYLPKNIAIENIQLNGQGKFHIDNTGTPNVDFHLESTAGQLLRHTSNAKKALVNNPSVNTEVLVNIESGLLNIQSSGKKQIKAQLNLPFVDQPGIRLSTLLSTELSATNNVTDLKGYRIKGDLQLGINNIGIVEDFIADVENIKGNIDGLWRIRGTVANPSVEGKLILRDAQMHLITPGLHIENMQFIVESKTQANGKASNVLGYILSAESGDGTLTGKGQIDIKNKSEPKFSLNLIGENFLLVNTNEANVKISPNLTIRTQGKAVKIRGKVSVPYANITPKQIPQSAVVASSDQVFVQTQSADTDNTDIESATSEAAAIDANILLSLGDQVTVQAFGFKGRTVGDLRLVTQPNKATTGTGEINILDGEYRAYGQGLVIEKGKVLFAGGSVSKPAIDIKAVRRPAEDITVGIFARGNIAQPTLTLFSQPSMSQAAQLSWLVLGQAPSTSKGESNNVLSQLALSLGLNKADSSLNKLSGKVGVDSINIKTGSGEAGAASDTNSAELVIGKYLSPNLYVSYGLGLFEPVSVLQLEYSLGKNWKLTTESSTNASGGDIIYTIDK